MTEFEKKKKRRKRQTIIFITCLYTTWILSIAIIIVHLFFSSALGLQEGTTELLLMVSLLPFVIVFIVGYTREWDIDPGKPPGEYKDNLIYNSFEDFLEAANKYFISNGFSEYKSEKLEKLQDVWVYHDVGGINNLLSKKEYHMLVTIITMEKLSEEYFETVNKAMNITYRAVENEISHHTIPIHRLYIFNVLNTDEEFHDYFSRDMYMATMSGKVNVRLMAGLSFDEKSLYIQKVDDLKGRPGYKILLSTFCNLMQIETPDFWTKKKKVKENKGEVN